MRCCFDPPGLYCLEPPGFCCIEPSGERINHLLGFWTEDWIIDECEKTGNGTVVFIEKQRVPWEGKEPMREGPMMLWEGKRWGDPLPPP